MKNKLFLTMLCAIWLCLIVACGMDFDTTTTPTAETGTPALQKIWI